MDDPFLMGVLERVADGDEEPEPVRGRERGLVAVVGDADAAHQFHDEKRPARGCRAGVEDLGDVRVIHHRQRLPLLPEAGDDFLCVHAELDDFQRHAPSHGLLLLGHPHHAEAAFADLLEELVRADAVAGFLGFEPREFGLDLRWERRGRFHKIPRRFMRGEQGADFGGEGVIARASLCQSAFAVFGGEIDERGEERVRLFLRKAEAVREAYPIDVVAAEAGKAWAYSFQRVMRDSARKRIIALFLLAIFPVDDGIS